MLSQTLSMAQTVIPRVFRGETTQKQNPGLPAMIKVRVKSDKEESGKRTNERASCKEDQGEAGKVSCENLRRDSLTKSLAGSNNEA